MQPGRGTAVKSSVPATDPTHGLRSYPADKLSSPLDRRTAAFNVAPGSGTVSAGYDYSAVEKTDPAFTQSIIPPDTDEGDIVGKEAWIKSWQEVKSS